VARRLQSFGHETEIVVISTAGDRSTHRAFADVGMFGIFVREIEAALLDGRVDVAVHSYKDLPSFSPIELFVAAVPERIDAADLLMARPEWVDETRELIPLKPGARVGTSAARRQALLRSLRPDLEVGLLRGNVPTRIDALAKGRFDAIVLAAAGVSRLVRASASGVRVVPANVVSTRLDPAIFVPAPAQGAIAVQVRRDAAPVIDAVKAIDDPRTARALRAERELLALAEGGCTLPFGAWCEVFDGDSLTLHAVLGRDDGTVAHVAHVALNGDDPEALADAAWRGLAASASVA
jgi:hydroxymethylbilane synthase